TNQTIDHRRLPKASVEIGFTCFIGIIKPVKHYTERKLSGVIVMTLSGTEFTRFDITLAITSTEENILPPAAFQHALGDNVMLCLVAVIRQLWPMRIPLKMRFHLIF